MKILSYLLLLTTLLQSCSKSNLAPKVKETQTPLEYNETSLMIDSTKSIILKRNHQITDVEPMNLSNPIDYTFSAISLPPGLYLDVATGFIIGTPTTLGEFTPNIKAILKAKKTTIKLYSKKIKVVDEIVPSDLLYDEEYQLVSNESILIKKNSVVGNFLTFTATGLPTGLTINPLTGDITGKYLDIGGNYDVQITASNTSGFTIANTILNFSCSDNSYIKIANSCTLKNQSRVCETQPINSINGLEFTTNGGSSWSSCTDFICTTGYSKIGNICSLTNNARACSVQPLYSNSGSELTTNGGVTWGSCQGFICNANYTNINGICTLTNQSRACISQPINSNGGTEVSTNGGVTWGSCSSFSCNANYTNINGVCILTNQSRSCLTQPSHSSGGTELTTNGGVTWGSCSSFSCDTNYTNINGVCTLTNQSRSCSAQPANSNGGTESSTDGGITWGSCSSFNCNTNYSNVNGICTLTNQSRSCLSQPSNSNGGVELSADAGVSWGACSSYTCNASYTNVNGLCSLTNQSRSCLTQPQHSNGGNESSTDGGITWGSCSSYSCDTNYTNINGICTLTNQSRACLSQPAHSSGGTESSMDAGLTWGSCSSFSCDASYVNVNGSCVVSNQSRSCLTQPAHSSGGTESSADGGSTWGSCSSFTCDSTYSNINGSCVLTNQSRSCLSQPSNSNNGTESSTNGGVTWGSCSGYSCNATYSNVNGVCVTSDQSRACTSQPAHSLGGTESSADGGVTWGSCSSFTCDSTYSNVNGSCVLTNQSRGCSSQPTNSSGGSESSTNGGVSWGSCSSFTCDTGYTSNGTSCLLNTYSVTVTKLLNQGSVLDITLGQLTAPANTTSTSSNYSHGQMIVLEATPSSGFAVTGWTGCDSVSVDFKRCTISSLSSARTLTPTFEATYQSLSTSLSDTSANAYAPISIYKNGVLCSGACLTSIIQTDTIRVVVVPDTYYVSNVTSFTMTGSYLNLNTATANEVSFTMGSSNVSVIANLTKVNHAPSFTTSTSLSFTINKNTTLTTTVNATDVDGDLVSYSIPACPSGSCSVSAGGVVSYTPSANYTGNVSFMVQCYSNGSKYCSPSTTISVAIVNPNTAPVATIGSSKLQLRNGSASLTLSGTDADGNALTYSIVSNPTNGTLTGTGTARTYTLGSWTDCATEGSMCSFTGTKLVKFGTATNYLITKATNGTMCSDQVLGDPIVGDTKTCKIMPTSDSFTFKVNDGTVDSTAATYTINYEDWYNQSWTKRMKLVFNTPTTSNLTDFPVLVKLDSSKINYANFQAQGQDLRFVDEAGNVLAHEIQTWNSSGTSYIWVKTTIGAMEPTSHFIWMYYGNSSVADGQAVSNVWSNGYLGVWHLAQSTGQVLDSTSYAHHGTMTGTMNRSATGSPVGKAYSNTSTSACFSVDHNNSMLMSKFTLESWAKSTTDTQNSSIIQHDIYTGSNWYWSYSLTNYQGKVNMDITDNALSSGFYTSAAKRYTVNSWVHNAITFNDATNTFSAYSNGSLTDQNTSATKGTYSGTHGHSLNMIGDCSGTGFKGSVSEIRISNVDRSSDWMKVQYLSMTDGLIMFSDVEDVSAPRMLNSYVWAIQSNNDDGNNVVAATGWNKNGESGSGINWAGEEASADSWAYFRFQATNNIPETGITNAKLKVMGVNQSGGWTPASNYLRIKGESSSNAPQVTAANQYPGGLRSTVATETLWNSSMNLTWNWTDWNISPNLSSVVSSIATNNTVNSGNYIQLWVTKGDSFGCTNWCSVSMSDYSLNQLNSAKLLIEW